MYDMCPKHVSRCCNIYKYDICFVLLICISDINGISQVKYHKLQRTRWVCLLLIVVLPRIPATSVLLLVLYPKTSTWTFNTMLLYGLCSTGDATLQVVREERGVECFVSNLVCLVLEELPKCIFTWCKYQLTFESYSHKQKRELFFVRSLHSPPRGAEQN